jgi:RNA polymerase sigma factor (sigma-70 family)
MPKRRPRARLTRLPYDTNEAELDSLMDRLADGDRAAFDPLYKALRPRAVRLARARLGDAHAEDVAQAVLLRVFSRASEFERGRAVLPWFYAIAANEVRAAARRHHPAGSDADPLPSSSPNPESQLLQQEMHRALDRAIADLDDDAAQALTAMLEERPPRDVQPSTFRKRVSRAYSRLRVILGVPDGR